MRTIILSIIFGVILTSIPLRSQNTNTIYFMDEIAERNNLNPAFIPNCKFYFDFIFLPNFYLKAGNNDLILRDLIYSENGITQSILSNTESKDKFFRSLRPSTRFDVDFGFNILSFGFNVKDKHYFTFDIGLQGSVGVNVPRDMFKITLYGTPDMNNTNIFNLNTLGAESMIYSNVSLGYMNKLNEKWTIGGKAKFLMGYGSVYTDLEQIQLETSMDNWTLQTKGQIYASAPIDYTVTNGFIDAESIMLQTTNDLVSLLYNPAGYGAAIDLGVTYKPIKNLTLSASITDLGFIQWNKNLINGSIEGTHTFEGVDYTINDNIAEEFVNQLTELGEAILNSAKIDEKPKAYNQMLYANFFFGAEYGVLQNKISFGALSRTRFNNKRISEEVTLSANFRPANWFKTSISYSFIDGRWGTIGLGLNLRMGMFNTYIIADYIPVSWANVTSENNGVRLPLPYMTQQVNLQAGCTWNIHRRSSDKDNDGVFNRKDKCPNTDIDYLRKACNNDRKKELVDKYGCPQDSDTDGVNDCIDQCPNTPFGTKVDSIGCPIDTDKDGIEDHLDECLDTPLGVDVDSKGCPKDDDKDGVPNYLDKCPNTALGVVVNQNGCPTDSDMDGITDDKDKCPNTPIGVIVDNMGCPIDSDNDGVADYLDQCPYTPKNIEVDVRGCPIDSDNDGVPDNIDECPYKSGPASNFGCPILTNEVVNVLKKALHGIEFETGKDIIKPSSFEVLDQIVAIMKLNEDYTLTIKGHTDNVGDSKANMTLSQNRAYSVKNYLIKSGIDASRLVAEGYGATKPIADNKTNKGRMQNRRVEFEISYTEVSYEIIENPEFSNE